MTFFDFILRLLPRNIISGFILLNICFGSLFFFSYQENYYSEIEIESGNKLNLYSIFKNSVLNKQNFNDWANIYKTELSYEDFSNLITIDNKYQFQTDKKSLRIIKKDKYTAYRITFKKDQFYVPHDFFKYLSHIKNEVMSKKISTLFSSNLSIMYFLGFELKSNFNIEEKKNFTKDYISQNLIINNPSEPKINGLNKLISTLLFLSLINFILILCLLIFNIKLIFRLIKN